MHSLNHLVEVVTVVLDMVTELPDGLHHMLSLRLKGSGEGDPNAKVGEGPPVGALGAAQCPS